MILSTYLVECIMQRVDFFLRLLFAETMLKIRIRHYLHNLFNLFFIFTCLTAGDLHIYASASWWWWKCLPANSSWVGPAAEKTCSCRTPSLCRNAAQVAGNSISDRPEERCGLVRHMLSHIFIVYKAEVWIDLTCKLEDRRALKSWWSLLALFRQFETLNKKNQRFFFVRCTLPLVYKTWII